MSKAFTKEEDVADEPIPAKRTALPPGVKNYITADGARKLRDELDFLIGVERPRLLEQSEDEKSKRDLKIIDARITELGESLQSAEVVQPPAVPENVVRFGATVSVRNKAGEHLLYRIVGVDEVDIDKGWVSWRSPIARALLNARTGQKVRFHFPAGEDELEIMEVNY